MAIVKINSTTTDEKLQLLAYKNYFPHFYLNPQAMDKKFATTQYEEITQVLVKQCFPLLLPYSKKNLEKKIAINAIWTSDTLIVKTKLFSSAETIATF
jgi:hypothetical protein